MTTELTYPVKDIEQVVQAVQVDKPLPPGDPRRYDFSALRGGNVVADLAFTLRQRVPEGDFRHRILCGHRGSGKTTELLALKQWADHNDFLTVHIEVDRYWGLVELQFPDLCLLAAERVVEALQSFGSPLSLDKLEGVVKWFAETTKEDLETLKSELGVEAGAEIGSSVLSLLLGKLFARFSAGVLAGSEHHLRIRQILRQTPDRLIDLTNDLFKTANEQLRSKDRPKGLLLLFDNLDRYNAEIIDALLLKGSTLVRSLACHAVFTMPINLLYDLTTPFWFEYGAPAVLPMIALRKPTDIWRETVAESPFDEAAVGEMLDAIKKRIDVDVLFQDPDDARLLVKMSGGSIRDLLHLVSLACQESSGLGESLTQIKHQGVQNAISRYRLDLTEGLQMRDYERLAAIARRYPEAQILDEHTRQLIIRHVALRYASKEDRWTDVHPLIIEKERFRHAFAASSYLNAG